MFGLEQVFTLMFGLVSAPVLLQGRTKLVEREEGERFKLKTRDGNEIDSMFVDRRKKG